MLVESPAATTLDGVTALESSFAGRPIMAGTNLLHAPAVRRMLGAVAAMDPHHLALRLAVPAPARGPQSGRVFGGGVTMDPASGFWPVVMAALGSAVESVAAHRLDTVDGLDRAAEVVLRASGGRSARADLSWGAAVAEASVEAADAAHVARVDVWPVPRVEIDGASVDAGVGQPSASQHPLVALGFTAQIERLVRVGNGEAAPWPDLAAASAALTVTVAAALSAKHGGAAVSVSEVPHHLSPFEILRGHANG